MRRGAKMAQKLRYKSYEFETRNYLPSADGCLMRSRDDVTGRGWCVVNSTEGGGGGGNARAPARALAAAAAAAAPGLNAAAAPAGNGNGLREQ